MIKLGDNKIGKVYLGDKRIKKIYLGDKVVFSEGPEERPWQIRFTSNYYRTLLINGEEVTPVCLDDNSHLYGWPEKWADVDFFNSISLRNCRPIRVYSLGDTRATASMANLFYSCSELVSVDMSWVDTRNVTDMSYMFYGCSDLESIDLSKLDTSKVTNMEYMFEGCLSIKKLDLSNFDYSKIIGVYKWGMPSFRYCRSLEYLDYRGVGYHWYNWGSSTNKYDGLFLGCSKLGSGSEENRKMLVDMFLKYSVDRSSESSKLRYGLHPDVIARFTETEKAAILARGYELVAIAD